jgi:hypothetical protein
MILTVLSAAKLLCFFFSIFCLFKAWWWLALGSFVMVIIVARLERMFPAPPEWDDA